jgi:hypothetical protein
MKTTPVAEPDVRNAGPEDSFEIRRPIVLSSDCRRVALVAESGTLSLPCVRIPYGRRRAVYLNQTLLRRWQIETYCLFPLETAMSGVVGYDVLHCYGPGETDGHGVRWLEWDGRCDVSFHDARDVRAIRDSLRSIEEFRSGASFGPFAVPGWLAQLFDWVRSELGAVGFVPTGRFKQLHASPTFALLRLETTGGAVWFKAVGQPHLRELPIHLELARVLPEFVPAPLATCAKWNGWLMGEVDGVELEDAADPVAWMRAAESLADLQIRSLGHAQSLLSAGCRDLRREFLAASIDPFLATAGRLMASQGCDSPKPLCVDHLSELGARLREACAETDGIPDAVGNLDFNLGNVIVGSSNCVFIDWSDGYIGNPFFTFCYLLEHHRRNFPEDRDFRSNLTESFAKKWKSVAAPQAIARALRYGPLLAAFAFALALAGAPSAEPLATNAGAAYFRSVTRRAYREARALQGRDDLRRAAS